MSLFDRINKAMNSTYNFLIGETEDKDSEDKSERLNRVLNQKLKELEAFQAVAEKTFAVAEEAAMELKEEKVKIDKLQKKAETCLDEGNEGFALDFMKQQIEIKEKLKRSQNWYLTAKGEADKARKDFYEKQREIDTFIQGMKYLERIDEVSQVMEEKQKVLEESNSLKGANLIYNQVSADILGRSDQVKGKEKLIVTDNDRFERDIKDSRTDREAKEALEELKRKKGLSFQDNEFNMKAIEDKELPEM